MFVYQNKDGNICVTFQDNKPVESPEYVIAVDNDAKALYMVSGEISPVPVEDTEIVEPVVEETVEEEDDTVADETTGEETE